MDPSIAAVVETYQVSTNLYLKALRGLDRAALLARASDHSNPLLWIAGHLAQSRCRLASIVGVACEVPWATLFATGSRVLEDDGYPAIHEITSVWSDVSNQVLRRLAELDERDLAAPPPLRVATPDGTVRGALALFVFHDAYHIGQMGFLRRWLGHSPLIDG